eukprot:CAMPEP_0113643018 /NCGR_PEP_ID=MMETSP0017_2-20120614/22606_1 /TAXON_ID=2856 /ORGANISM="Cylindrotheca closterium" /LENGTH=175 /DNA_ID=CAMNT_0000554485 /DNA_START=86 /DNA_END=613 /DNA_ORIENTATION=- /assembly_acc=CAM_ASM_000147
MILRLQAVSRIPTFRTSFRCFSSAADHQLNINFAIIKAEEGKSFSELKDHPVLTLQGIGPKHSEELEQLGMKTIQQMADYKFYHLSKAIATLAPTEETGNRIETSQLNLNRGLIKEFEPYALQDLLEQPVHALQGLTPKAGERFASLGVKNVGDLANFKYCRWAEAIVTAAKFEE